MNYGISPIVFPKGIKKMIDTIKLKEEINNTEIMRLIKRVNTFSKLLIASLFLIVFMSIVELLFI
jgi:transposase-like protein